MRNRIEDGLQGGADPRSQQKPLTSRAQAPTPGWGQPAPRGARLQGAGTSITPVLQRPLLARGGAIGTCPSRTAQCLCGAVELINNLEMKSIRPCFSFLDQPHAPGRHRGAGLLGLRWRSAGCGPHRDSPHGCSPECLPRPITSHRPLHLGEEGCPAVTALVTGAFTSGPLQGVPQSWARAPTPPAAGGQALILPGPYRL